jgi:hypothetical protein
MEDKILQLKKLNAAYIASLEWDYCPQPEELNKVIERLETGISKEQLGDALLENQGSRPDEIAGQMSELIKTFKP